MKPVFINTETGRHAALLATEGTKLNHVIIMDSSGLTVTKVPKTMDLDEITSCKAPLEKFRQAAKSFGCTKTVARHLGLKDAIPAKRGDGEKPKSEDGMAKAKKTPVTRKQGAAAPKRKAPAKKPNTDKAAKSAARAERSAKGESKAIFVEHFNAWVKKGGDFKPFRDKMQEAWGISADRAVKRVARISREVGVDFDNPKQVEA